MTRALYFAIGATLLAGCAHSRHDTTVATEPVISVTALPFERRFQMHERDAHVFRLPDGKTVAVWCERPPVAFALGEQTTASGLKTAWGERPFKRPEPIREQIAPNSYRLSGWRSYISQGAVTTYGDLTTEYVLYAADCKFSIIEDLRATGSLPVTIRVSEYK